MNEHAVTTVVAIIGPVIAVFLAFIAYQQYRLERLRTRMQLYEKRAEVFRAVLTFISRCVEIKYDRQASDDFYRGTVEGFFLFDAEVNNFMAPHKNLCTV